MAPHKHAAVIKAWADGAEIEYRSDLGTIWQSCMPNPAWALRYEYRIKPKFIRYRNFLWTPLNNTDRKAVCVCSEEENKNESRETWTGFIKWLGDWQKVEIP